MECPDAALLSVGPNGSMNTSLIPYLSLGVACMTGHRFREHRQHTAELRTEDTACS
ncbi:hypothetical protein OG444_36770 [Streptomyces sp. NBC_01232]|uniref:hypothetical protein n=1 Tax=unclassified Streptomyces TaxID=2593676 RepID=UPI002E14882D|nr:hypothetical protein OG444_36770 [Streptomyces sp. NBC_01232]